MLWAATGGTTYGLAAGRAACWLGLVRGVSAEGTNGEKPRPPSSAAWGWVGAAVLLLILLSWLIKAGSNKYEKVGLPALTGVDTADAEVLAVGGRATSVASGGADAEERTGHGHVNLADVDGIMLTTAEAERAAHRDLRAAHENWKAREATERRTRAALDEARRTWEDACGASNQLKLMWERALFTPAGDVTGYYELHRKASEVAFRRYQEVDRLGTRYEQCVQSLSDACAYGRHAAQRHAEALEALDDLETGGGAGGGAEEPLGAGWTAGAWNPG
ncbi:hypothetical protein EMIHUDRAFT_213016 [Emiliania huxleyi CCMP1516]|uniref:Uncharacterized protein n=2 Tax=Emiliania huxleyi TaxID=2903 RepID=A0A0D3INI5_EMIH1|nr:hypothetical protein EMIHUDRAFT_213016 [Emiliania huxleyi CCMP1516]EOD12820.1 hypothetical protein EMIHUDRAFT_213016 [Emiliania huxleyi CCMP1516]|eukprot:XP_005765249.1 hypothetical protein EMIHUDRAFT_213016 [Emiliania huxleyi CCMP1516]